MLKIKKTKPYQFRKSRGDSARNVYARRVVCALALICGIVPSLALLSNYNVTPVSAVRKTLSNITTMQEMTTDICNNSALGQSNTLTDTRDGKAYSVSRLADGNCWMTENLKLDLTQAGVATAAGSDNLLADFPTEALTIADKFTSDNTVVQFSQSPTISTSYPGDGKGHQPEYGYYYSWCAATGSTCKDDSGAVLESGDAAGSICPKGWKLPKGGIGTENDFAIMGGIISSVDASANYWSSAKSPSFSGNTLTINGSTWIAAGSLGVGGLNQGGSYGNYWPSTAYSSALAYGLLFYNRYFNPAYYNDKYIGRSVRCLTPASSTNFPDRFDEKDVEVVAVRVAPVISIDATSGMKEEVDPNKVTTGTISATVSANTTYAVQLSANKTSLTNSQNPEDSEITNTNSIPASSNVQAKTNAWGILNQDNSTYSAITTNPTTYYNTEEYNEEEQSTKHTFSIGVSISPTLPAGEYSTTVTITAVNN